ncbi:MAG: RlmE family RNA methyltransferase [Spirochaetota bacterium]|nr:RlmE family RNA methyltransferase [Spirochaetota bacterium]
MKKIKDFYFHQAKEKNYSARSVFKLQEIDDKYKLIKNGFRVIDLGASPGSWTEYTFGKIGQKGEIVAIDLKPLQKSFSNNVHFIQENILELDITKIPGYKEKFDLILSDMAPNTTGIKGLNHQQSLDLCTEAVKLADNLLKVYGNFVCKVFQGEDLQEFIHNNIISRFESYKLFKPKSSRKESVELFILGFKYKKQV